MNSRSTTRWPGFSWKLRMNCRSVSIVCWRTDSSNDGPASVLQVEGQEVPATRLGGGGPAKSLPRAVAR